HFRAEAGERLVDGIVDDLENHVMQAGAVVGVADVHPGPLAHRFEPLQHLDAAGVVGIEFGHLHWEIGKKNYTSEVPFRAPCSTWNTDKFSRQASPRGASIAVAKTCPG